MKKKEKKKGGGWHGMVEVYATCLAKITIAVKEAAVWYVHTSIKLSHAYHKIELVPSQRLARL